MDMYLWNTCHVFGILQGNLRVRKAQATEMEILLHISDALQCHLSLTLAPHKSSMR